MLDQGEFSLCSMILRGIFREAMKEKITAIVCATSIAFGSVLPFATRSERECCRLSINIGVFFIQVILF